MMSECGSLSSCGKISQAWVKMEIEGGGMEDGRWKPLGGVDWQFITEKSCDQVSMVLSGAAFLDFLNFSVTTTMWAARGKFLQQRGEESGPLGASVARRCRGRKGQALRHAPDAGRGDCTGGSFPDVSEQVACRRRGTVMRQARANSQRKGAASSDSGRTKWENIQQPNLDLAITSNIQLFPIMFPGHWRDGDFEV